MLFTSNRLAICGTVLLALAISGVVFLITDLLFQEIVGALVVGAIAARFGWFWYGPPLLRKAKEESTTRSAR